MLSGLSEEALRAHRVRALAQWKDLLAAEERDVRRASVKGWERAGVDPAAAAAVLVPFLTDADPEMRRAVRDALRSIGAPAVDVLLRAGLSTDDWELPAITIEVLGLLAQANASGHATPALLEILGDSRKPRTWRARAAMALGHVRPVTAAVRAALRNAMRDPDKEVAAAAIDGIGSLGAESEELVPTFLAMLEDPDQSELQPEAAFALGAIGLRADAVIPALERWCAARAGDTHAATAIARFGKAAFPWLRTTLTEGPEPRRRVGFAVIEELGADAGPLAPFLVQLQGDRSSSTPWFVTNALRRMGPAARAAVPDIVALILRAEQGTAQYQLWIWVLPALGPDGEAALRGLLTGGGVNVRSQACFTMASQLARSPETRPLLEAVAEKDPEERVRECARWALRELRVR
jgi:HEAT repeat protein